MKYINLFLIFIIASLLIANTECHLRKNKQINFLQNKMTNQGYQDPMTLSRVEELLEDEEAFDEKAGQVFNMFDLNEDGLISKTEFRRILVSQNVQKGLPAPSDDDVKHTLKRFDKNGDEYLDREEFDKAYKEYLGLLKYILENQE